MSDKRRRRRRKQARRYARRKAARERQGPDDNAMFWAALRRAARGHPANLLSVASMMIHAAKPGSDMSSEPDGTYWDSVLAGLIEIRNPESSALLAVIAEMLVDDPNPQRRCRREVAERGEQLPRWIQALSRVEVYRAVRRSDVFGDVDELVIGMRLSSGHELTFVVAIDHNKVSSVAGAGVVKGPIDKVLTRSAQSSADTLVLDMTPADARAWIEDALGKPAWLSTAETWPLHRPLVQWLMRQLPGGGERRSPACWLESAEKLRDAFFASDAAAPFTDPDHRELLSELFEYGTGDPLRWSAIRVKHILGATPYFSDTVPLEVALDAPDLLRAFIPFAHAQSGIRDELTAPTIAVIDKLRSRYKREVLREAESWWADAV